MINVAWLCFFSLFLLLVSIDVAKAQYELKIVAAPIDAEKMQAIKFKSFFTDSVARQQEVRKIIGQLYAKGFLATSVDSMEQQDKKLTVYVTINNKYKWVRLQRGNVDERVLNETGKSEKRWINSTLSPQGFSSLVQALLSWYENHGYPFAEVSFDSIDINQNLLTAILHVEKNERIVIDTILVKGNAKISSVYLFNYLSVKPGDIYNESIIRTLSVKIKELPMVAEALPFTVSFEGKKAVILLYLNDRKASQADGIIGFLPDAANNGKVTISGDVKLRLISAFGRGEQFELNWKQPAPKTQDLKTRFNYPFLFSSPFGVEGGLTIYKKDSTYLDVILNGSVQYLLRGNNFLKIFITNKKSTLLSTSNLANLTVLPSYADVTTTLYGLGYKMEKLDYRLNPTKGFSFEISGGAGNKIITKNSRLNDDLYKNLKLKSATYSADANADLFIPVFSKFVLNIGTKAAWMSAIDVFQNEQFRFGGLKTLRGFDEESIFATTFCVVKAEYRYLLDRNSFLQVFYNHAYYESITRTGNINDDPFGFGAGITFETKLGIFSLNYALGKQFSNPIQFRSAKVHFGIVNYF